MGWHPLLSLTQAGSLQQLRSLMMASPLQLTSQYMLSVHVGWPALWKDFTTRQEGGGWGSD